MRDRLAKRDGMRALYRATFVRYGVRYTHTHLIRETVLLKDITTKDGYPLCDHVWMAESQPFRNLDLKAGERIQFVALTESYRRKTDGKTDYRLTTVTRLRKV